MRWTRSCSRRQFASPSEYVAAVSGPWLRSLGLCINSGLLPAAGPTCRGYLTGANRVKTTPLSSTIAPSTCKGVRYSPRVTMAITTASGGIKELYAAVLVAPISPMLLRRSRLPAGRRG